MRAPRRSVLVFAAVCISTAIAIPARAQNVSRLKLQPAFAPVAPGPRPMPRTDTFRVAAPDGAGRVKQSAAAAASRAGWEIEFHSGGSWTHASAGTMTLPEPGATFLTFNGAQSRFVRSWYFGDGTAMINAHLGSATASRVTALDPILNGGGVRAASFSPFGVRASRPLSSKLGVEAAFEMMGGLGFTGDARSAAEATRSSFQTAFNARFSAFATRSITSELTQVDGGAQMLVTGAITFDLRHGGRFVPYIVAGGGALISTGDDATIGLVGDYSFLSTSSSPYHQTDTLNVRYASGTAAVGLAGGGIKFHFNDRSGLRADFRMHFAGDPVRVLLNWNPETFPGTPANTIAFAGTPALQISTANPLASSLSIEQMEPDYVATTGGMRLMMNWTVGYFYRF